MSLGSFLVGGDASSWTVVGPCVGSTERSSLRGSIRLPEFSRIPSGWEYGSADLRLTDGSTTGGGEARDMQQRRQA